MGTMKLLAKDKLEATQQIASAQAFFADSATRRECPLGNAQCPRRTSLRLVAKMN